MNTRHYRRDRQDRENCIRRYIGYGTVIASFLVDRGHANGAEIHEITDTAIINIYNERTHRLVTKLIARPGQIRRYYEDGNAPQDVLDKAYYNTAVMHYNNL